MVLKDLNLTYSSDEIEIRSIKIQDINGIIPLWKEDIIEDYRDKITDEEIVDQIYRYVRKDLFGLALIFIILRNNEIIGYSTIWHDDTIKFKTNNYKKQIFNFSIRFISSIDINNITKYLRLFIESLVYFKLNIRTIYCSRKDNESITESLLKNGFEEITPELFYSKLGDKLEKMNLGNPYKTSNIIIKNII